MRWLLRWQHVAPQTQLAGERGLLEALRQLQGFEVPANAWEKQVLACRLSEYDPAALDQFAWRARWDGDACRRIRQLLKMPAPAAAALCRPASRRSRSSSARIPTGCSRGWPMKRRASASVLSENGRTVLDYLRRRGASFFSDIERGTGKVKGEIATALWELVAAGMVTADGFENLRSLIDPKRHKASGSQSSAAPTDLWALVACSIRRRVGPVAHTRRGNLLDASPALWRRVSRSLAREVEPAKVARIADRLPSARRPRRSSRRALCQRISG